MYLSSIHFPFHCLGAVLSITFRVYVALRSNGIYTLLYQGFCHLHRSLGRAKVILVSSFFFLGFHSQTKSITHTRNRVEKLKSESAQHLPVQFHAIISKLFKHFIPLWTVGSNEVSL